MSDQPIRLGIIGAGIMGERMLRAALEHAADLVEVTAIWDASAPALDRLEGLHGARTESAEAVLAASDCVYVATPPATHLRYAELALLAGRAVFLEKPLATDVAAANEFVREYGAARAAVNFPFASSFAVERLRGWLDEGAIGAPTALEIEVGFATWPRPWQQAAASWLDAPAEGGFTREVVSHFLFLARRVLGPLALQTASVDRAPGGTERRIEARLTAGGLRTGLTGGVGTTGKDDHNTFTLHGTGALRLRDWSWAERQRPDGSWAADPDAAPNEKMRPLVLRRQLEQVAAMTRGQPHKLATLSEAFEVQAAVEAILAPPADGPPSHA
ncbi:MAG: Gfo/Idh/MocA family protein [Janthinobacterium lividum]